MQNLATERRLREAQEQNQPQQPLLGSALHGVVPLLWRGRPLGRGSLTTIHANSAKDALRRLAHLAMRGSGSVHLTDIEEECRHSIDVIVHVARISSGQSGQRRAVTELTELRR